MFKIFGSQVSQNKKFRDDPLVLKSDQMFYLYWQKRKGLGRAKLFKATLKIQLEAVKCGYYEKGG